MHLVWQNEILVGFRSLFNSPFLGWTGLLQTHILIFLTYSITERSVYSLSYPEPCCEMVSCAISFSTHILSHSLISLRWTRSYTTYTSGLSFSLSHILSFINSAQHSVWIWIECSVCSPYLLTSWASFYAVFYYLCKTSQICDKHFNSIIHTEK